MALLGAADIIDRSWEVVRRNVGPVLALVGVFLVPSLAGSAGFAVLQARGLEGTSLVLAGAAIFLPVALLSLLETVALVRVMADGITGAPIPPLGTLLRQALPLVPATFFASLALSVLMAAGFILLVVPALVFAVWFAFVLQAIVLDGTGWVAAFSRSKALSAGRFFPVLWRLVAPYVFWLLVSWVVSAVLVFLLNGAAGSFTIRLAEDAPLWLSLSAELLTDTIGALVAPFFIATSTALYLNLKAEMPGERQA